MQPRDQPSSFPRILRRPIAAGATTVAPPASSLTPVLLPGQPSPDFARPGAARSPATDPLPDFLPGRLCLRTASAADYNALASFHYRAGRPATWARVLAVTYEPHRPCDPIKPRIVAIGVLSWPTAVSRPRRRAFGLAGIDYAGQIAFANRHIRTISRIIVHPQFRGLGLARLLIQRLCADCPTRFVEATAAMADAHPMFERAGMHRLPRTDGGPAYFWLDRAPDRPFPALPPADGGARRRRRARTAAGGV